MERSSGRMTATMVDEAGDPISSASLDTLTLTLFEILSKKAINGRDDQNVLNANNVTVNSSGELVWTIQPADNALIRQSHGYEVHRALFEWTWDSGTKRGLHYEDLLVQNLATVT